MIYDFSGYATKNEILCDDGRVIKQNAFKDCDGMTVPLVYNHDHKSLDNVIGHVTLENRPDGVYCYGNINKEVEAGRTALSLIKNGDLDSLSVFANKLKQNGRDVTHGVIREVSLVLAGANRGAKIDSVLAHGTGAEDEDGGDAVQIFSGSENPIIHSAAEEEFEEEMFGDEQDDESEELEHAANGEDDFDLEGTIDTMNEDQIRAMKIMMGIVAEEAEKKTLGESNEVEHSSCKDDQNGETTSLFSIFSIEDDDIISHNTTEDDEYNEEEDYGASDDDDTESDYEDDEDDDDDDDDETLNHSTNLEEGENEMRQNVFEDENNNVMIHSAEMCQEIMQDALKFGSLKDSVMAHSAEYGIDNIDYLFPNAKNYTTQPEFIKRRTEWVNTVMDGVRQSPFSRVKTIFADITEDEARAKGYIKGNRKVDEVFALLKRETTPTTVYKKQTIDRDDIIDITDFSVIEFIKQEMRVMFDEECARAILVGDGRNGLSPDKIKETNIRPIWTDDDLFTVKRAIAITAATSTDTKAEMFIDNVVRSLKLYRGSGAPTMFITSDLLCDMLLLKDTTKRRMYNSVADLQTALRVSKIVEVPVFDGLYRIDGTDTKYLGAILVNLSDYVVGRDRGGALSMFDDFDIDFNKQKYLMESRFSGALVKPYSAIAYEFVYNLTIDVQAEDPTITVLGKLVSDVQQNVFVNDNSIQGTLKYVSNWTGYSGDPEENSGYFVVLKYEASEGATTTIQTIGGYHDEMIKPLDVDMQSVTKFKDNKQKLKIVTTLEGETITKILSFSGLRTVQA